MKTAVQRWGNSLALRIPSTYAAETRISEGSEVEVTLKSGALVVRPLARKRRSLESLLKQVTAKNLHDEVATGRSVGKEIW
jgi:antitoxin MazE